MKLSGQDVKLFYRLMWALQFYVNQKLKIHAVASIDAYADLTTDQKAQVRDALYDHIKLIDAFIQENPQHLAADDLAIISEWKKFIRGSFYIERFLKKYAVFIKEDNVYGVLGLATSFAELAYDVDPPLYVETVLLPFKGKIIYDGLMRFHPIFFGGGIKRSLKETYLRAKQNRRITDSLEQPQNKQQDNSEAKASENWKPELEALARMAKKLKGSSTSPAIYSPAFSLVKASIEFARLVVSAPNDHEEHYKALRKVSRAFNKANTVLYREEY